MKRGHIQIVMIAIWALLLIAAMVIRPDPHSSTFWILMGIALTTGSIYMFLQHQENRQEEQRGNDWKKKLTQLLDQCDVQDDGHLFEQYDSDEWCVIFELLENTPKESRSLLSAIRHVDPDFRKNKANKAPERTA